MLAAPPGKLSTGWLGSDRGLAAVLRLIALLLLTVAPCRATDSDPAALANFGRVNAHLFRGAQPSPAGITKLAALGVKIVINLRMPNDTIPGEAAQVRAAGMTYQAIPLRGLHAPTLAQIEQVLALIGQSPGPVFVHCQHGADRTGTVVACYRIRHDGWTVAQALAEAKAYRMSWVQFGMKRFIRRFPAPAP